MGESTDRIDVAIEQSSMDPFSTISNSPNITHAYTYEPQLARLLTQGAPRLNTGTQSGNCIGSPVSGYDRRVDTSRLSHFDRL